MNRCLVAVINGTKARFFTLEFDDSLSPQSGPSLVERGELLNPAKEMAGQDLWANVKTGHNRNHSYDDHRGSHLVEFDRRFAQSTAAEVDRLVAQHGISSTVLVAEPQTLGLVREYLSSQRGSVHELAKDLCRLKPQKIHDYLAQKSLIPPRQRVLVDRYSS